MEVLSALDHLIQPFVGGEGMMKVLSLAQLSSGTLPEVL